MEAAVTAALMVLVNIAFNGGSQPPAFATMQRKLVVHPIKVAAIPHSETRNADLGDGGNTSLSTSVIKLRKIWAAVTVAIPVPNPRSRHMDAEYAMGLVGGAPNTKIAVTSPQINQISITQTIRMRGPPFA